MDTEILTQHRVIAVLTIDSVEAAVPVTRALLEGGVAAMELTLRTPFAIEAIRAVKNEAPEMKVGAGTVLTVTQVDDVIAAGADFAVAPGTNPRIIQCCADRGIPFGPGVATPSDIEIAVENGCRILKYFPAETLGGLKHLKNMAAPYRHLGVRFIPLGGISAQNMRVYLDEAIIAAIGGSWIASRALIQHEDWDQIRLNAKEAALLADGAGTE
jgi:2-dehydro-3-deoxyphosphogluconate aldolase/(4S)-4-hydroxy-2-oxoglutarate aldolase